MCTLESVTVGNKSFKVADIKRKYIENIIDAASKCDIIDRVVLFGSSIEERCKESSDIDIAVFGSQVPSRALTSKKYDRFTQQLYTFDDHSQAYDILYFKTGAKNKNLIMNDIHNGEVLYER